MPRAAPLPLDERRAALIQATVPLLVQHGREVSTRQIAEAAGIAEGTIFRAYASKEELIDAVLHHVFDPAPTCALLAGIDGDLDLRERLTAVVRVLQRRTADVFGLFHALKLRPEPGEHVERQRRDDAEINAAIVAVIQPDAYRLSTTAEVAAKLLRAVTFAVAHPIITDLPHDRPELVVDLLLHGLLEHARYGYPLGGQHEHLPSDPTAPTDWSMHLASSGTPC